MKQNEIQQENDLFLDICKKIYSGIATIGLLCVLLIFPLYYRDYYFDILEAKYQFYYLTMLAMFGILLLMTAIFFCIDCLEFKMQYTKDFLGKFSLKEIKNTMTWADWFLAVFLIVCVISTLHSSYLYESFWGNEGRFTGLFLHLIYIVGFWSVSRLYQFKPWHGYAFLIIAMIPLLFGITDYFKMDILNFKVEISKEDMDSFTSTFGNINTYATFVGIVFGCFSAMFVTETRLWKSVLCYIGYLVTVAAMIMGNSDNAVFALAVIFAFLPLAAFRSRRGIERYLLLVSGFALGAYIVSRIDASMNGQVVWLYGFFGNFIRNSKLKFIVPAGYLAALLLHVFRMRDKEERKENLGLSLVKIWGIFLVICLLAGIFILYDANAGGNSERYGALGKYLKFSDEWGTFRGLIWRITLESYQKQPFGNQLFGHGLDTFGVMTREYRGETSRICGQVFDSAHNEYMQYLVTVGPVGLLAYVGFFAASLKMMLQKQTRSKWGIMIAFGVSCYLAQAFVTINLPIVTPIMWMLLSMGMAASRQQVNPD